MTGSELRRFWSRISGTSRFRTQAYLELKGDNQVNGQAILVLALSCVCFAIGFIPITEGVPLNGILVEFLIYLVFAFVIGILGTVLIFILATRLLGGHARLSELARPLFFSSAPGILFLLEIIRVDIVVVAVTYAVSVWIIAGGVVVLKNVMGFGYDRSMLTFILGFLIGILVAGIFNR